jgi:hypothetical protein
MRIEFFYHSSHTPRWGLEIHANIESTETQETEVTDYLRDYVAMQKIS